VDAGYEAELDRIATQREHDWYRRRCRLGRQYRRITSLRYQERDMAAHEVCRQCGKPIVTAFRPAIFDRDIRALDGAGFLQTLLERRYEMCIRTGRCGVEIADHWHTQLLRPHRKRPCHRAAKERDELAPLHSITSSARTSRAVGIARPSALAVLRLMNNS